MMHDPLIEEIRKRREDLMREYDFDVHKIYMMLKEREEKVRDKMLSQIVVVSEKGDSQ